MDVTKLSVFNFQFIAVFAPDCFRLLPSNDAARLLTLASAGVHLTPSISTGLNPCVTCTDTGKTVQSVVNAFFIARFLINNGHVIHHSSPAIFDL
jgi:hypothetical protein